MDLPKKYSDEDSFKKVMFLYDSALKEVETKIEILNNEFKMNSKHNPIEHVTSRIKSPQSIAKKLRHNDKEFTIENMIKYINDIAGMRIICSFKSDIFDIAEAISSQNDVEVLKIKDYVTYPKENGYSSYHMIVAVPIYLTNTVINTKVEIQIRTIAMDYWASLEHKIYYKFEGDAPEAISDELKECADIVSYLDDKMLSINKEVQNYKPPVNKDNSTELSYNSNMKESFGSVYEEDNSKVHYNKNEYLLEDYRLIKTDLINADTDDIKLSEDKHSKSKPIKEKKDGNILKFFKMNSN